MTLVQWLVLLGFLVILVAGPEVLAFLLSVLMWPFWWLLDKTMRRVPWV